MMVPRPRPSADDLRAIRQCNRAKSRMNAIVRYTLEHVDSPQKAVDLRMTADAVRDAIEAMKACILRE